MNEVFDETRLDDEAALEQADLVLRPLAEAGARVRRESVEAAEALAETVHQIKDDQPRAVVAAGPDSRLLRAVLEPHCPVPFVAWPGPGLPGWAGSLDLVVMLAPGGEDPGSAATVSEAVRRGAQVVVGCPPDSLVARHATGRHACVLPARSHDQLATAVVVLDLLARVGLGPSAEPDEVADALDEVAVACSPHREQTVNPAKQLAVAFGDCLPVVWGGSVLAARAARRVSESMRRASGRSALAGDAEHLLPVIAAAVPRDLFDDPFAEGYDGVDAPVRDPRPALLVLDDGSEEPGVPESRARLTEAADERDVRVEVVECAAGSDLARYASLLGQGRWAAAYLGIGLGRRLF